MDVNEMTRRQLERFPYRKKWDETIICDSIIILPVPVDYAGLIKYYLKSMAAKLFHLDEPYAYEVGHIHDSGYRCMDFVAVVEQEARCHLSDCSDIIHIEGIGGFGLNWLDRYGTIPDTIPAVEWDIDCLKVSGLLRLFPRGGKRIHCGAALSSFEVYSVERNNDVGFETDKGTT